MNVGIGAIVGGGGEAIVTAPAAGTGVGIVVPATGVAVAAGGVVLTAHGAAVTHNTLNNIFSKGVDPNHHNANVRVSENGKTVSKSREVSGNMTPEQKAKGFPRGQLDSHTEPKALRKHALKEGQTMTITGQKPPCPTCKGVMNKAARETGAKVRYQWRENGKTQRWETQ
jgi:hypothetical protein